jgi:hypothetical protein
MSLLYRLFVLAIHIQSTQAHAFATQAQCLGYAVNTGSGLGYAVTLPYVPFYLPFLPYHGHWAAPPNIEIVHVMGNSQWQLVTMKYGHSSRAPLGLDSRSTLVLSPLSSNIVVCIEIFVVN